MRDDPSDKRKDSVLVEEVEVNEPSRSLIISDQLSNENIHNCSGNIVFFGDSIPKGIKIKDLNSRLYIANYRCCLFGGPTSKHFHQCIRPIINEMSVVTDIGSLHMRRSEIIIQT